MSKEVTTTEVYLLEELERSNGKIDKINNVMQVFWDNYGECHDNDVEDLAIECINKVCSIMHGEESE